MSQLPSGEKATESTKSWPPPATAAPKDNTTSARL
jgi:hypothetical protein